MLKVTSVNWPNGMSFLHPLGSHRGVAPDEPQPLIIIEDDEWLRAVISEEEGLDLAQGGPDVFDKVELRLLFEEADEVSVITKIKHARGIQHRGGPGRHTVIVTTTALNCVAWATMIIDARRRRDGVRLIVPAELLPDDLQDLCDEPVTHRN